MRFLLFTNGTPPGLPALRFGMELATALGAPAQVIGFDDGRGTAPLGMARRMGEAVEALRDAGLTAESRMVRGRAEEVIPAEAGGDDVAVIGPLGRSGWLRWLRGPSIGHILRDLPAPTMYVPAAAPGSIRRILLCSGGLAHAEGAVQMGGRIASAVDASLTLLHIVVPTVHLPEPVHDRPAPPEEYLEGDSVYARNLRQARDDLERKGVRVDFRLRAGDPLLEILAEIRSVGYDLVIIGSHSVLEAPARLVGDITVRIVEGAGRPVLVVPGPTG